MSDIRYLAVAVVIGTFMLVTIGHVANYAGSFEANGWWWLGWPYAVGVDLAIVICAWLTRWQRTQAWAWSGYFSFVIVSGLMNAAAIEPWLEPWPDWLFAWIYSLFPTAAIGLLGFLARQAEQVAERGKPRGIIAKALSLWFADKETEQPPSKSEPAIKPVQLFTCPLCARWFGSQAGLNAHQRSHRSKP